MSDETKTPITITKDHSRHLQCILGNSIDNTHDMRGQEGATDSLVLNILAVREFLTKFPECKARFDDLLENAIDTLCESDLLILEEAEALLTKVQSENAENLLADTIELADWIDEDMLEDYEA